MQPDQSTTEDNEFTCSLAEYNLDKDADPAADGSNSFTCAARSTRASKSVRRTNWTERGRRKTARRRCGLMILRLR